MLTFILLVLILKKKMPILNFKLTTFMYYLFFPFLLLFSPFFPSFLLLFTLFPLLYLVLPFSHCLLISFPFLLSLLFHFFHYFGVLNLKEKGGGAFSSFLLLRFFRWCFIFSFASFLLFLQYYPPSSFPIPVSIPSSSPPSSFPFSPSPSLLSFPFPSFPSLPPSSPPSLLSFPFLLLTFIFTSASPCFGFPLFSMIL